MKFFKTIDKSPLGRFFERKAELIANTDPERVYIENIRSFFNVPYSVAKFFCELAVRTGYYTKWTGYYCKNDACGRMIASTPFGEKLNGNINCMNCEILEREQHEFNASDLDTMVFYKVNRSLE